MTFSPNYLLLFFFFNDTATPEIYTLSLHDALPISKCLRHDPGGARGRRRSSWLRRDPGAELRHRRNQRGDLRGRGARVDRKSTRLNSSHVSISYAVFCLKKKKTTIKEKNS